MGELDILEDVFYDLGGCGDVVLIMSLLLTPPLHRVLFPLQHHKLQLGRIMEDSSLFSVMGIHERECYSLPTYWGCDARCFVRYRG